MKYYYHPASPNCRKVSALIRHLGTEIEQQVVDLPKGEHLTPWFLEVNPNGTVPALVDDKLHLWESNAIVIHLAGSAGSDLWPDDHRRTEIVQWMFWEQSHFMFATGTVFFQRLLKPMIGLGDPDEERVAEAVKKFRRYAKVLDDHLAGREWLVGDSLTLADLAIASQLMYAVPSGLPMEELANTTRWLGAMDEIGSVEGDRGQPGGLTRRRGAVQPTGHALPDGGGTFTRPRRNRGASSPVLLFRSCSME